MNLKILMKNRKIICVATTLSIYFKNNNSGTFKEIKNIKIQFIIQFLSYKFFKDYIIKTFIL